jgi:multisubunit Na+/H+ antiporter MnhE subunit
LTVDLTEDRSGLLLHFFEARDVEAQVAGIRRGLEPLVQEVFE